jgi:hypothetical protein
MAKYRIVTFSLHKKASPSREDPYFGIVGHAMLKSYHTRVGQSTISTTFLARKVVSEMVEEVFRTPPDL